LKSWEDAHRQFREKKSREPQVLPLWGISSFGKCVGVLSGLKTVRVIVVAMRIFEFTNKVDMYIWGSHPSPEWTKYSGISELPKLIPSCPPQEMAFSQACHFLSLFQHFEIAFVLYSNQNADQRTNLPPRDRTAGTSGLLMVRQSWCVSSRKVFPVALRELVIRIVLIWGELAQSNVFLSRKGEDCVSVRCRDVGWLMLPPLTAFFGNSSKIGSIVCLRGCARSRNLRWQNRGAVDWYSDHQSITSRSFSCRDRMEVLRVDAEAVRQCMPKHRTTSRFTSYKCRDVPPILFVGISLLAHYLVIHRYRNKYILPDRERRSIQ
jgi:hypothetical protein